MSQYGIARRELLRTVPATVLGLIGGATVTGESRQAGQTTASSGSFTEKKKLVPGDGDKNDAFGSATALSGDGTTALIGAQVDEDPNGGVAGAVYVFRDNNGWQQTSKLSPSDIDGGDNFGASAALSKDGTTAVVGSPTGGDPEGIDNTPTPGEVHVFEYANGSWQREQKLTGSDTNTGDRFGQSVAVSDDGTRVVVGARKGENANAQATGVGYVFENASGSWQETQKLEPSRLSDGDRFGDNVALSGDGTTAVFGVVEADPNGSRSGSTYVFEHSSGSWQEAQRIVPDNGDSDDAFGSSVGISKDGTTIGITATGDEGPSSISGGEPGSLYVYGYSNGVWQRQAYVFPDDASDTSSEEIGDSLALTNDGNHAAVGAPGNDDGNSAGRTHVFSGAGGWSQQAELASSDRASGDRFGNDVDISEDGTTVLVGAVDDDNANGEFAGSAYVYESTNTAPTADAGSDQTVSEQSSVTLDGSASTDPDGDSLGYTWRQTVGPSVSLSDPDTKTPTFTAPSVGTDTTLTFELTVDDGSVSTTDTTSVTVTAASSPLSVTNVGVTNEFAGSKKATVPGGEVVQGETVEFTATVTNTGSSGASDTVSLNFGSVVAETIDVNSLPAGAQTEVYANVRIGTLSPGSYTLTAGAGGNSTQTSVTVRKTGDVDHDGAVDAGDATKVQKQIVGIDTGGNYNPAGADTTQNTTVDSGDVTRLQKIIVGLFSPGSDLNLDTTVKATGTR